MATPFIPLKQPITTRDRHNFARFSKFNDFLQMVGIAAQQEGLNPHHIWPMFKQFSSADFVFGPQYRHCHASMQHIPRGVLQRMHLHYNVMWMRPFMLDPMAQIEKRSMFKERSMVFVTKKLTEQLITGYLREKMESVQRLYQYLNWTIRISKVARRLVVLSGQNGHRMRLLVINVELHNKYGDPLYAVCIPNDVTTAKAQPWQLAYLLSAREVVHLLAIDFGMLPEGVRAVSAQFEQFRRIQMHLGGRRAALRILKAEIAKLDSMRKAIRYAHLKCIQTGNGKKNKKGGFPEKVLNDGLTNFYTKVRRALTDDEVELIPIVSIVSRKNKKQKEKEEDFSVDFLLPVRMGSEWVGVVYRDLECCMALMDCYDVSNKAILCDPSFDVDSLEWFKNSHNRLRVVPDDEWCSAEWQQRVHLDPEQSMANDSRPDPPSPPSADTPPKGAEGSDLEAMFGLGPEGGIPGGNVTAFRMNECPRSHAVMQRQMMAQRQWMLQQQRMAMQSRPRWAGQSESGGTVSAEGPNETPALPLDALSEDVSNSEEMDYLLFGAGKHSEDTPRSPTQLTPAPHSQNWQYQMTMMRMGRGLLAANGAALGHGHGANININVNMNGAVWPGTGMGMRANMNMNMNAMGMANGFGTAQRGTTGHGMM